MTNSTYDFAIVGAGPIGAASAYFLSKEARSVLLLSASEEVRSAYPFAGGSVRWYWGNLKSAEDRERMTQMTSQTAEFIKALAKGGEDLSLIEDNYLFLTNGVTVPSINISGNKLVQYFIREAIAAGAEHETDTTVRSIVKDGDTYAIEAEGVARRAKRVLVACGARTHELFPGADCELEKRELLVLDVPVSPERARFPHTIAPLGSGIVYLFVKSIDGKPRLVLGEEDIVKHGQDEGGKDFLPELLELGLLNLFPFLKGAKTGEVLWGFDPAHKSPRFGGDGQGLLSVTCGSAIRSCVAIGQMAAERLLVL